MSAFTAIALLVITDVGVRAAFPHFVRLSDNFSAAYLRREIASIALDRHAVVFLGDSALWGYRLPAAAAAPSLLREAGCDCHNFSFEGGSPANTYAMLRLLLAQGMVPRAIIFNVNQKEFNPVDSAYQTLHPSVQVLAVPLLDRRERTSLTTHASVDWNASADAAISKTWALYGMRSDLREALFNDVDAVHALQTVVERQTGARAREQAAHVPTADRFEGTYDLSPLAPQRDNVSVAFLRRIGEAVRARHIPTFAILTPTNHRLLHDYIDTPPYEQNLAFTRKLLSGFGITVLNFDRTIPSNEFIDNDHLTVAGNRRLASLLRSVVAAR